MRLIDAEDFERRCMFDGEIEDMQDVIYALRDYPSVDAVEVVRCKDCKHVIERRHDARKAPLLCDLGLGVQMDDYCSYGKRAEK